MNLFTIKIDKQFNSLSYNRKKRLMKSMYPNVSLFKEAELEKEWDDLTRRQKKSLIKKYTEKYGKFNNK